MSQPNFEKTVWVDRAYNQGVAALNVCSECKALIEVNDLEGHREFHAKMDELIEWAQSVSALFGGESNEG